MSNETIEKSENATVNEEPKFDEYYSDFEYATAGHRLGNWLIDLICIILLGGFFGIILGVTGNLQLLDIIPERLLGIIILILYYSFFETMFGQSVGKMITKTKVVNQLNEKPSFLNIVGRTLCRLIPFDGFSFLFGLEGWHDSISKTRVIKIQ